MNLLLCLCNVTQFNSMSSDTVKCGVATLDPFRPAAKGACLPTGSCPATYRASAVIRVDGVLGPQGQGIIMVNPSVASDAACLWYSNGSTFTQSPVVIGNSAYVNGTGLTGPVNGLPTLITPGLTQATATSLPFQSDAMFGFNASTALPLPASGPPQVRARIVSCGVKITFSGTTLNDGGVAYCLVDPQHENLIELGINNYLSLFTSCKIQRLSLRDTIALNLAPVTRNQQDLSSAYDEVPLGSIFGGSLNGGYIYSPFSMPNPTSNFGYGYPNVGQSTQSCVPCDAFNCAKAASTLLYPLSRRNQRVIPWTVNNSTTTGLWSGSVAGGGLITWTSIAPDVGASGMIMSGTVSGLGTIDVEGVIWYRYDNNSWYFSLTSGVPTITPFNFTNWAITGYWCEPSVIGAVIIQAGTAMAGQTFHIEYVVHCEYSGVGVQGRTENIIPDPEGLAGVHAVLDLCRESAGQHERANIKDFVSAASSKLVKSGALAVKLGEVASVLGKRFN
ncbi:hypothetical protein [Lake Sarah-associated circular virus-3]|uniref:hypothetical protein n=1 Tax=Lake Sarah-associated circular virus-3 TaxID=1685757 RepID=UPI000777F18D|nr:hypothetical protein A0R87_gp2 [Lake Sarah-associated circular virus-3]ALE29580.1 hypothetical protein [Lake Sarah-associated circular virus-3]ALE29583.1 hypothetical protein [Lake Sarah-associated circular virus-3]